MRSTSKYIIFLITVIPLCKLDVMNLFLKCSWSQQTHFLRAGDGLGPLLYLGIEIIFSWCCETAYLPIQLSGAPGRPQSVRACTYNPTYKCVQIPCHNCSAYWLALWRYKVIRCTSYIVLPISLLILMIFEFYKRHRVSMATGFPMVYVCATTMPI